MPRDPVVREAKRIIDRVAATPRAAGSAEEAAARKFCAEYLERAGFEVSEEEFKYSSLPGRWGVPLAGLLVLAWFLVLAAALDGPAPERTVVAATPYLLLLPILYFASRQMVRYPGFLPGRATNLVGVRGSAPRIWLVAHLDSKSQPVPMLLRVAGMVVAGSALLLAVVGSYTRPLHDLGTTLWVPVTVAGVLGSLAVLFSVVGNRSRGAVDNASGVAAAVLSAVGSPAGVSVGVLLTSAEELGLAGARAWVREQAERHAGGGVRSAINFDGLDDVGTLTCMAGHGAPLVERLRKSAAGTRSRITFRRVLPGILVDAMPLREAGWDAVTLSRGNLSTLARIHTRRDTPERLAGTGVAEAVALAINLIEGGS